MLWTFRLLGPWEVRRAGDLVSAPAGRTRALLALFLLDADRSVSRARAVGELWGERLPPSAAANLRTYVSALRGWFGAAVQVVSHRQGWRLIPGPGVMLDVDVINFEAALESSHRAGLGGDVDAVADHLHSAVGFYRGSPLQDVPSGPALSSRSATLTARWMSAVEEYAATLLTLRRYEAARLLLQEFLSEQPYRERAWGQLMVACGNAGDIASALGAYDRARQHLAEGLGVAPSDVLTDLHRAILRGDAGVRLADLPV